MNMRWLGRTGLQVSEIALGTWPLGGPAVLEGRQMGYGPVSAQEARQIVHRSLELGVNLIDVADCYGAGKSEELIGDILNEYGHQDIHIITKVGVDYKNPMSTKKRYDRPYIQHAIQESLKRLKRDVVDVYMLHSPNTSGDRLALGLESIQRVRDSGLAIHIGVSVSSVSQGIELCERDAVDVLEIDYNILNRSAEDVLLPLAGKRNIGVIVRRPLESGLLTGSLLSLKMLHEEDFRRWRYTEDRIRRVNSMIRRYLSKEQPLDTFAVQALRFALKPPQVSSIAVGAGCVADIEAACLSTRELLTDAEATRLCEVFLENAKEG